MDIIHSIEKRVIEDEPCITKYDLLAGGGDCGETLLNGIQGRNTIRSKSMFTR
jgi:dihydroxyacetone kinase